MSTKYRNSLLILISALLSMLYHPAQGQFYNIGNDPAKTKWMQIRSKNYTLIFPQEIDSLAREYLNTMEKYRPFVLNSLRIDPKPIPVVLHPYTVKSNGMVAWAPKRVELYTIPPAYSGYSESWIKQLVLHETRHIGQTSYFTTGIYKYLYWFIGEQSTGLGVGLYPGLWQLESDAVATETILGDAGRGRNADFLAYHRAAFLSGDLRNWDRWKFGSYRHYTPDIYSFGYLITSVMKAYCGNQYITADIFSGLVENFYNPNVLTSVFRRHTGKTRFELLDLSIDLMTSIWSNDLLGKGQLTKTEPILQKSPRYYTEYTSLLQVDYMDQSYTLAKKEGMDQSSSLVKIDSTGKEKRIRPFNYASSDLKYNNGKIYWTEQIPGVRWELESYSALRSYDLSTGKVEKFGRNSRYFNPSVNPSGDIVAVAEYRTDGSSHLVTLSPLSKEVIGTIPTYDNGEIKEIVLTDTLAYCTIITSRGMGLYSVDLHSGDTPEWINLIPDQHQTITDLTAAEDRLLFTSDLDGVNNIYQFNPFTLLLHKLTNSPYGASSAQYDYKKHRLIYNSLTLEGKLPVSTQIDSLKWEIADFSKPYKHPVAELMTLLSGEKRDLDSYGSEQSETITEELPVKRYRKSSHLFRFHSWAPLYYNVDRILSMSFEKLYDLGSLGAVAYSQNTLGTLTTMLGYSYHGGFHSGHANITYSGLFPVIEYTLDFNDRNSQSRMIEVDTQGQTTLNINNTGKPYLRSNLTAYIPFNFSSGGWHRGLIPQITWSFNNDTYYSYDLGKNTYRQQLRFGMRYYQILSTPKSSIFPRSGFGISMYGGAPLGQGENFGNHLYIGGYIYAPGFTSIQGAKFSLAYQRQFTDNKVYYSNFYATMPRGITDVVTRERYIMGSVDYAIPVYLGDISISWVAYLQRMKIIPFADYAFNSNEKNSYNRLYSVGTDLMFDIFFFRLDAPVSIGMRYARNNGEKPNYFGLLFNISIK